MGHKYKMLLPKAVLTKTVCGAAAAAALTTGAVLGTSAYQSGMNFHPSGTEREFNANQVNFSDDKDVKGRDSTEENKEDFLQKDKDADDANDPKKQEGGNYLLENEQQMQQDGNSMSVIENVLSSSPLHPGGTALIGISKPVVKAHGSSNAASIFAAVRQAIAFAGSGLISDINANIEYMKIKGKEENGQA